MLFSLETPVPRLGRVCAETHLSVQGAAFTAVTNREKRMSSGMKQGIALPLGEGDAVGDPAACIGVSDRELWFVSSKPD